MEATARLAASQACWLAGWLAQEERELTSKQAASLTKNRLTKG